MAAFQGKCGAVAEWSKALAWKVSIRQNRIEGSNPSRSATRSSLIQETEHGLVHWRLLVRRRPVCGVGTALQSGPLPLPRLPQASRCVVSCVRDLPGGCGGDRGRNTRVRRAVFLPALRLFGFRRQWGRNGSEPRVGGCARPAYAELRTLDDPPGVLVTALSTGEAIRAGS